MREQTIGIIGKDREDINHFIRQMYWDRAKIKFVCITRPNDADGFRLDAVIQTSGALLNKKYADILDHVEPCLL